ncbi:tetratricopeptide repeat protein [Bradyrhizobium erythrophlei]|uniref:Lipopolysaccharide biosynthesis regulator YciM, contains six TPR domains and a predicted metal-binding C-terminal domain n=1 Tax=Bradyrhizobium erythrophlei TaxID=1437360 RepID=A0A1M5PAJ4_9BRAD|nr:tetratricopeptide repeat protein [Bradyrhizobium erythrophlei]SHG98790.1 Lipopolysaccharide biosynthesis regulator YciM, contains six TPR domains and a predicted metal-binding C-terminal domain [Bradyrhizobium erythrophlei]
MFKLFECYGTTIRSAVLVLTAFQLAGCGSPDERAQTYYEHGMQLFSEHDNAKAAIELRNAVRLKKGLLGAWKALADIDEINRNWPGVVADLRTIVELNPNDISARLKLGKLLLLAGSSDEALRLADVGIELDNRNAELHALKAATSFKLDDRAVAVREAETALELDPANADARMVLALDRLGKGDAKGALSILEDKSGADENNLGVQLLKIKLFRQTGDLDSVEAALKRLVELNPQEHSFRKLLINFYIEQRRTDDAEKEMRALASANPADSAAELDVARFLYAIKKAPAAARQELNARISAGGEVFPYQMALADMDFAEGKFTDGKQLLENLSGAGSSPEHGRAAKIALGQIYLSEKNFDPAETLIADILRDDPHNVPALKLRASIHLERAQLDAATADLLDALNYQPRSTDLMLLLATAYERNGLIELADKQFADAMRTSDFDSAIGLQYAAFLQRRGSIARAEDILTGLNKRRPNNIQILSTLAQVRLARRNWSGALEIAESIRRIGNDGGTSDQILGAALIGSKKYDEAIAALQKAYDAAPTAVQPVNSLVAVLLKVNKKDQAIIFLKSVLARNPGNANALVLLGSIQLASGAGDQALASFLAAVKAQPKDLIGYQALADLYLGQKNYDEAINVVRTAIQQQPAMMDLHMILAGALERKADYETAISEYEFVLDKQPANLIAANNLASLLLDRRTDKASLKKAQSLAAGLRNSPIPQFKDTLGWVSYLQGDYRTAVSLSEEAAAALPDQAAVRYHLGMGYISTGQPSRAAEQLGKALKLGPNNELADQIRAALKKAGT